MVSIEEMSLDELFHGHVPEPKEVTRPYKGKAYKYWAVKWTPKKGMKRMTITGKSRDDCFYLCVNRQKAVLQDQYVDKSKKTLDEFFQYWIDKEQRKLAPNTKDTYLSTYKNHIQPYIGKKPLQEVARTDWVSIRNRMEDTGKKCVTIKHVLCLLRQILKVAKKNREILFNPLQDEEYKAELGEGKEPYTRQEIGKILDTLTDPWVQNHFSPYVLAGLCFLIETGARRSEMLGMKWDCIDFANKTFHIKQTVVQNGKGQPVYKSSTKTVKSNRVIACYAPKLWELLNNLEYNGSDFAFTTKEGEMLKPRNFDHSAERLIKRAGVEYRGVHAFRRSFITFAVERGIPDQVIESYTGHSSARMIDHYHKTQEVTAQQCAQIMGGIYNGLENGIDTKKEPWVA